MINNDLSAELMSQRSFGIGPEVLWTLPYKDRIIIGPREGTDRHVTDHDHHNHYDH